MSNDRLLCIRCGRGDARPMYYCVECRNMITAGTAQPLPVPPPYGDKLDAIIAEAASFLIIDDEVRAAIRRPGRQA